MVRTPAARTASRIAISSSTVSPVGFSSRMCLPARGRRHGLRRVQVVRRGDVDDVDVVGLEQVLEARRHAGAAGRLPVLRQRGVDAIDVAADQRHDIGVGILVERGDVLRGAPADPDDTDSETCGHRRILVETAQLRFPRDVPPPVRSTSSPRRLQAGGPTLVLTGAGISLASGIPTFRGTDAGAVWASNVMARATLEHFQRDPADSWSWYRAAARAGPGGAAEPGPSRAGRPRALARGPGRGLPADHAEHRPAARGRRRRATLVKVHGSIDRARCADASCPESETDGADGVARLRAPSTHGPTPATVPRCAACGDLMRPHVLWFDEHYGSHPDYGWPDVLDGVRRDARWSSPSARRSRSASPICGRRGRPARRPAVRRRSAGRVDRRAAASSGCARRPRNCCRASARWWEPPA